jgi:hypothetical protein
MKITVSRRLCCVSLVQTGLTFQRCLWPPSVWWCIYRIRTAITMSTKTYHYILSWATSHTGSLRSLLTSSLHLLLGAPHFFFPWSFHKNSPLKQFSWYLMTISRECVLIYAFVCALLSFLGTFLHVFCLHTYVVCTILLLMPTLSESKCVQLQVLNFFNHKIYSCWLRVNLCW